QDLSGTPSRGLTPQSDLDRGLPRPAQLDSAPARLGSARARRAVTGGREMVVDGEFLTGLNRAAANVKDVTLHHTADQVRIATVVNDLRPAAAHGSIEGPIVIYREQVRVAA